MNSPPSGIDLLPSQVLATPKPLVLGIPGGGCSPVLFERVAHPRCLVHGLDWGAWPRPADLETVAGRLAQALAGRMGPTLLAGVSLGGVIAMLTALEAPGRVNGLLLSNTGANSSSHGDPALPQRVRTAWTTAASDAFLRSCFHAEPDPALWRQLRDYMARLPKESFLQSIESVRRIDVSARLTEIRCPVVIAHGRFDRRRSVGDAEALARAIPAAELRLLDCGHSPMAESPGDYTAALDRLLVLCGLTAG